MKLDSSRSLLVRLFAVAMLVLVVPAGFLTMRAIQAFEQAVVPEMDRKAAAVGRDVAAQVERAVQHGIPLARLVGVDEFFAPVLASNPEIRYLAITDDQGDVLFLKGADAAMLAPHYRSLDPVAAGQDGRKASIGPYEDLALPVVMAGAPVGFVHVGFDLAYVRSSLVDILYDVAVVLVVSLVVAFEFLLFVIHTNITGPLKRAGAVALRAGQGDFTHVAHDPAKDEVGRFVRAVAGVVRLLDDKFRALTAYADEVRSGHFDPGAAERVAAIHAQVAHTYRFSRTGRPHSLVERWAPDIRLPLFLFVFAEELSRPFMPLYAGQVPSFAAGLPVEMLMALPIALFMLCAAVASPMSGDLAQRLGARRLFLLGMVPVLFGHVMTALAQGAFDMILWRSAAGIGYALVTVACQSYMAGAVRADRRTQGLGAFMGAVLTAGLCGTLLGGVLAERVGFRPVFVVSALLVLLAGLLVSRLMNDAVASGDDAGLEQGVGPRPRLRRLLRNWRFSVLMAFAAVPSKIALTGFLFFLVPVTLWRGDWDLSRIGLIMALYPLVMLLVAPVAARLSDRLGWNVGLVAVGGLIGGIGLLAPLVQPQPWALVIGVVALGISHGLSSAPLLSMLPDVCWTEYRSMGQTNVLAFVRFVERVGSTLGPLLAAAFLLAWGPALAMLALGVLVVVPGALFAVLSAAYGGPNIEPEEEDAP